MKKNIKILIMFLLVSACILTSFSVKLAHAEEVTYAEEPKYICVTCKDVGSIPMKCPTCNGSGLLHNDIQNIDIPCSNCKSGFINKDCPDCQIKENEKEEENAEKRGLIWGAIIGSIESLFLKITVFFAGLIDLTIGLFKKFIGLENVTIGTDSSGNPNSVNLIMYFLENEAIRRTVMVTIIIGLALLFVFTIIQMVKSAQNSSDEKLHPSRVFESFFKALLNIVLVPLLLVFFISCSNVVMGQINKTMETSISGGSGTMSYGGNILLLMAETKEDKAKLLDMADYDPKFELDYFPNGLYNKEQINQTNKAIIYTHNKNYPYYYYSDTSNWTNETGYYYIPTERLNITVGFLSSLCLLFVLIVSLLTFVQRLFDLVLLYIVSPLLISTQPLDDGKRFAAWRDMTISKTLSAYGMLFSVNIYYMIVPILVMDPGAIFFNGSQNVVANSLVQLMIVIGGAFAINKANLQFAQLLGSGTMESQQGNATLGAMSNMIRSGAGIAFGVGAKAVGGAVKTGKFTGSAAHTISGVNAGGTDYLKNRFYSSNMGQNYAQRKVDYISAANTKLDKLLEAESSQKNNNKINNLESKVIKAQHNHDSDYYSNRIRRSK